ncbi:MAG TPA: hypothetical protein VHP14_06265 [Anaerolineales bacterium]|nr:hypothetical protein [Anaerolineales bacterium]
MILRSEATAGRCSGWKYVKWSGNAWQVSAFRVAWSVAVGFLPQWATFTLSRAVDIATHLPKQTVTANLAIDDRVGSTTGIFHFSGVLSILSS